MSNREPLFWNPAPWRYEKETGTIWDASGDSVLETAPDGHPYVEPDVGEAIVSAVNLHLGGSMSFANWLHNFFAQHKLNPHKVAGALAASKTTIDSLGAIEKWAWLPQFDDAMTKAIAALSNWQAGDSKTEIVEALQAVQSVLGSVKGLSQKDEAVIAICAGAVESGVALFS